MTATGRPEAEVGRVAVAVELSLSLGRAHHRWRTMLGYLDWAILADRQPAFLLAIGRQVYCYAAVHCVEWYQSAACGPQLADLSSWLTGCANLPNSSTQIGAKWPTGSHLHLHLRLSRLR